MMSSVSHQSYDAVVMQSLGPLEPAAALLLRWEIFSCRAHMATRLTYAPPLLVYTVVFIAGVSALAVKQSLLLLS